MHAGRLLGEAVKQVLTARELDGPVLVLGVPRGGVVVAAEVARALGERALLDVVLARKIGAPGHPELAVGAVVGEGPECFLDERALAVLGVSREYVEAEVARQRAEIRRRAALYRAGRPEPPVTGHTVVVVDDGIATGYTVRAALAGVRARNPGRLVLAVPVAPPEALPEFRPLVDDLVCLLTPEPFMAVGAWYRNFDQTTDEEVAALLREAQQRVAGHASGAGAE